MAGSVVSAALLSFLIFMRTLRVKFVVYLIVLVVFVSLVFLAFFINRSNVLIKKALVEVGFSLVKSLSYSSELGIASEDEIFLKPYLDRIFEESDVVLVTIYNEKGEVIVSNKKVDLEEKIPKAVVEKILKKEETLKQISYSREGKEFYDFYSPILIGELLTIRGEVKERELAGFARVALSLESITYQNKEILAIGSAITAVLIFLNLGIAFFLASKMTKPIREFIRGVEVIGGGNLKHQIKIKTGDEIEELAKAFNKMTEGLRVSREQLEEARISLEIKVKARTKELEELAKGLEDKVKERTKELQRRIEELEKFHRLTVGRELKMVELKKEIRELKREIEESKGRK